MQAIVETLFDTVYLASVITIGILMIRESEGNAQFKLFGLMAVVLGAGDAFHGAFTWAIERGGDADPERLIRFASAVAAVSVSSFGTRQWLTSPALVELVRGW